jgi:hypothetical protein
VLLLLLLLAALPLRRFRRKAQGGRQVRLDMEISYHHRIDQMILILMFRVRDVSFPIDLPRWKNAHRKGISAEGANTGARVRRGGRTARIAAFPAVGLFF